MKDNRVAAENYANLCKTLMREQIIFDKTGEYSCQDAQQAYQLVYTQESMRGYIESLMLTYLFWPNHYAMMEFYWDHILKERPEKVLEIGAGHGLFSSELLRLCDSRVTIVDISPLSIEVCKEMAPFGVNLNLTDYITWDIVETFDFIIMGEVLEHVDDPTLFLRKTHSILSDNGSVYLTTCAECPAVDHVYRFKTVDEIREMVARCGFSIDKELVLSAPPTTINYAAVLRKHG